jgi:hypothetical protein
MAKVKVFLEFILKLPFDRYQPAASAAAVDDDDEPPPPPKPLLVASFCMVKVAFHSSMNNKVRNAVTVFVYD